MTAINMPQVGQDITTARIVEWTKKEGDTVRKGEVIAVVESDKATFEVQADQAGVLLRIDLRAGEEGEVFKPIAWLGQPGEQVGSIETKRDAGVQPETSAEPTGGGAAALQATAADRRPCSPAARRLARELGVDLSTLTGSGPGGRIVQEDVLAALSARPGFAQARTAAGLSVTPLEPEGGAQAAAAEEVIPFSPMRERIAERLSLSKRTIPHFYLSQAVDMTAAQQWRQSWNDRQGNHLTVNDLVVYGVARALLEFPHLNAHVEGKRLRVKKRVNLGLATAVRDGVLVPVIPEADQKTLAELSTLSKQVVEAARRGVLDSRFQGTFTVSSLGQYGVPWFLPVINPPECGILGVGVIQSRVMATAEGIAVRQMLTLTLGCDHRAVDGAYAAGFLGLLKKLLESTWRIPDRQDPASGGL